MRRGRRVTRKERVRVLAVRITTREKEKGQRCALTVGSVAMTLRDAGRSILNSFLGHPPMLLKRTTTISVITLTTTA